MSNPVPLFGAMVCVFAKGNTHKITIKKLDCFSYNEISFIITNLFGNQIKIKEWLETLHLDIMHIHDVQMGIFNFTRNQL